MRRRVVIAAVPVVFGVGAGLWLSSGTPARSGPPSTASSASSTITLTCKDSVGQQGRGGETVVGGVEGLLPGSGNPAALDPIQGAGGKRYFVYKAFLAVSSAVAPYATVSIISPGSAKLVYGSPGGVGDLSGSAGGRALVAASRGQLRLPVCGRDFTGYVGGIVVTAPTWVTFAVSSPHGRTARVSVPIGVT